MELKNTALLLQCILEYCIIGASDESSASSQMMSMISFLFWTSALAKEEPLSVILRYTRAFWTPKSRDLTGAPQAFLVDHNCGCSKPATMLTVHRRVYSLIYQHLHLSRRIFFGVRNRCRSPRDGWKLRWKISSSRCIEFSKQHS